jgi:hypothetical protein
MSKTNAQNKRQENFPVGDSYFRQSTLHRAALKCRAEYRPQISELCKVQKIELATLNDGFKLPLCGHHELRDRLHRCISHNRADNSTAVKPQATLSHSSPCEKGTQEPSSAPYHVTLLVPSAGILVAPPMTSKRSSGMTCGSSRLKRAPRTAASSTIFSHTSSQGRAVHKPSAALRRGFRAVHKPSAILLPKAGPYISL